MPSLTTTQTTTPILTPALRKRLAVAFAQYQARKAALDAAQAALDAVKATITELQEESGAESVEVDGFKATLVAPIRKQFDRKAYAASGGDLKLYDNAMVDVTSRPYVKISLPKGDE